MGLRQLSLLVLACSFLAHTAEASTKQALNHIDGPAVNFSINTPQLSGSLADLKGKVAYIDFWPSWCKPCRQSFLWMNEMQDKYADAGLQVIAINLDAEPDLAQDFLAKVPANMLIVYDPQGNIAKDYQLLGMPSSYIVDKPGRLRFAHKGFLTQSKANMNINFRHF
ncbi:MAG: thiol-disulfide isomerase/thioredoxin [Paraglaciecola sp.]